MKPSEIAEIIRQALNTRYPTGIAYIRYYPDVSTLEVLWVDDTWEQIEVNVRSLISGEQRWERVQG